MSFETAAPAVDDATATFTVLVSGYTGTEPLTIPVTISSEAVEGTDYEVYDIDDGNIYLDNNDIYNIKRTDLRKSYAMVLQDTWLFQASVYENLSYSREDITKMLKEF